MPLCLDTTDNNHIQLTTEGLENVNIPDGASARGDWCAGGPRICEQRVLKLVDRINKHVERQWECVGYNYHATHWIIIIRQKTP